MLFNSLQYFAFYLIVASVYFLLPLRFRWAWLLGASCYFYMAWKPAYILLLTASTLVGYFTANAIGRTSETRRRRLYLWISVGSNLGFLFIFKYFNFLNRSMGAAFAWFHVPYAIPVLSVLLPVGISFYTFQNISYTVDVYRREFSPERHFGLYALYHSFFPLLVAGPIERARNLLPQFHLDHRFDPNRLRRGAEQILWGLFKKVVVADRLALYVDAVYDNYHQHSGLSLLVATYFFAVQIYCDFSGYSDIAIGSARILGIDLMENFNLPYFSRSITEFWRRWHISLSTWLRDYLYISLGGNRIGPGRTVTNLFITMLLGGLWHGANWTFVVWGLLHGLFLSWEKRTVGAGSRWLGRIALPEWSQDLVWRLCTFHLVCLAWVFFRAKNVTDAFFIVARIITAPGTLFVDPSLFAHAAVGSAVLVLVEIIHWKGNLFEFVERQARPVRWACYYLVIFGIVILGVDGGSQFIYFQF